MQVLRTSTSCYERSWTAPSNNACHFQLPMYIFCSVLLLSLGTAVHGLQGKSPSSSLIQSQIPEDRSQKEVVLAVDGLSAEEAGEQHRQVRAVKSNRAASLSTVEDEAAKSEADAERSGNADEEHDVPEEYEDSNRSQPRGSANAQFEWRQLHSPISSGSSMRQSPKLVGSLLTRPARMDSNFIRFGRSYNGYKYFPYSGETGGDVTNGGNGRESRSSSNLNYPANKKNNFIRLGRENGRQNNFIRLGRRSGEPEEQKRLSSPFYSNYYVGRYPTSSIGFFPSSPVAFYLHKSIHSSSPASLTRSSYHTWGSPNDELGDRDSDNLGDSTSTLLERSPLNDGYSPYYYNH